MERTVKLIGPEYIEEYLTIYLNAYPAFKDIGDEGREEKRQIVLTSMKEDQHIHFYGLFEENTLIAVMKLIDFSMNLFGEMKSATGLMSLAVHPLHKKKGAALDMVRFFENYTKDSGGLVSLLLPFRMEFYRKMGYGYGSKLEEYRIPTLHLPACSKEDLASMRILEKDDFSQVLSCHSCCTRKNHGMLEKFEDEIRDMKEDTQSRRIGYIEDGTLKGYIAFRFASDSEVNYTLNRMEVSEIVYDDSQVFRALLGFLRLQADLAQTVVLRTGEEDFYHILDDAQDVSGNYINFGFLQTNISAVGTMYKIPDIESFIAATKYRRFSADELSVTFVCDDELNHEVKTFAVDFQSMDQNESRWSLIAQAEATDVTVHCKLSDLSSLFLGSCHLASLVRLGSIKLSNPEYLDRLDHLLHCQQKPWTNTDY